MKRSLALLLTLVGCGEPPASSPPSLGPPERFLFFAVLEGLYAEGIDPATARALLSPAGPGHFVDKCPICGPVRSAFEAYASQPRPRLSFKEADAPAGAKETLAGPDRTGRMEALRDLVDRSVARRIAATAAPEADRQALRTWLADGRKKGMAYKHDGFGDFCPSCDGAALKR